MPIYDYLCEKCESEFEVEQRITADPVKTCPNCRSRKVKRLISKTSFVLKGGGWYSDLYSSSKKSSDKPESSSDSSSSDSSSSDSSSSKSDSKSKSKSDSKTSQKSKSKGSGSKSAA